MSYTLTQARQALADALSALPGVNVRLREVKNPRSGVGWTVPGQIAPDGYRDNYAQIGAIVLLSQDAVKADAQFDTLAVAILNATKNVDGGFGVRLDPASIVVGDNSVSWSALTVQLSVEVSA